jgi:amino-acid N-acetyltransferase
MMIDRAKPGDVEAILALIREARLHDEGVEEQISGFLVARENGEVVGAVGMEVYGPVALLRSMVVSPSSRKSGVGARLCDTLLDEARRRGVREIYLLTIDAQDFFARFGFEIVERSAAPEAIRNTWEFSIACPDTAFFMQKNL